MTSLHSLSAVSPAETPVVAVIAVRVPPQTVEEITREAGNRPWAPVHEVLDKYLGESSRAHWSMHTKNAKACIAIVDFDQDPEAALATVGFLDRTLPGKVSIIALASGNDPALILKAMRAGCSEYLEKPFAAARFAEALARLEQRLLRNAQDAPSQGQILSFLGAKGGVGTTTLAVHLAVHLARGCRKKTLLIDNHTELGHVCLYLGLEGEHYSFHELLRSVDRLDIDLLQGFVIRHASGLDVIASAELHGGARNTDPEALERTLEFLREEYDYVLLDCSCALDEANVTVVDRSERAYLIATPDIGAVRDLSRLVDGLIRYQQPAEKLRVIVNRSGSKGAMSAQQIEKAVRLPLTASIPNSYAELAQAASMGVPAPAEGKSAFSSELRGWGREVAGTARPALTERKKGLLFWRRLSSG